jgi:C4-dicarboxylate transporter DctM subunit
MSFALGLLPVLLLVLGFPVFLVLLTASCVALAVFMHMPLAALQQNLFGSVNAYALLAIPYFIFAGELMERGSVARRLVAFVRACVGPVHGSLGFTTIGTGAIFGAISGVSAASVATVGRIMYPSMREAGYAAPFSAGLIAAVGAVGVVIPPSIPMIVYAAAAEQSIPRLYAAGLVPGLLIVALLAAYTWWHGRRSGSDEGQPFDRRTFLEAFGRGVWALGAPAIILGGIYGGIFSPTEAAAVACVYTAVVTRLVFRELTLKDLYAAGLATVTFSAQILIIIACAGVFSWLLTVNQVPAALIAWVEPASLPPWLILIVINLLLLAIGCVIDPLSAILLLTPLLLPVIVAAGIDPVHFGIVMTVNLAIGLFTPPFGINIFVAQSVFEIELGQIYRGVVPFFFVYLVALALITFVPALSLAAVRLLVSG